MNPHTHQVKLCDFGSTKVLVCFYFVIHVLFPEVIFVFAVIGMLNILIFFNVGQVKGEPNISYICSRYYRAPELIFGATEYTTAIDIWSAGCVLADEVQGQVIDYSYKLWSTSGFVICTLRLK